MSIFSKKQKNVSDESDRPAEDDYAIRKSRRADIIIGIISIIILAIIGPICTWPKLPRKYWIAIGMVRYFLISSTRVGRR